MKRPDFHQLRYTVMVVPAGGQGPVRRFALTRRHLTQAVLVVSAILFVLLSVVIMASWQTGAADLEAENQALRAQLGELEQVIAEAETELEQFHLQRARLEGLAPEYGPLDDIELQTLVFGEARPAPVGLLGRAAALVEGLRRSHETAGGIIESELTRRDRTPSIWPVDGRLTSGMGMRKSPIDGRMLFHQGLDIAAPLGTPVVATAAGVVSRSAYSGGYGNLVEIDHGQGVRTRYAHNTALLVGVGDVVERGEVIATVGSTGRSTGPHVHYEVRVGGEPKNPLEYIQD
ncbi:MAG: M23 family metallopeptidase [Myxococcota bacterium]